MTPELQTAIAVGFVLLAGGYYVTRWLKGGKNRNVAEDVPA